MRRGKSKTADTSGRSGSNGLRPLDTGKGRGRSPPVEFLSVIATEIVIVLVGDVASNGVAIKVL